MHVMGPQVEAGRMNRGCARKGVKSGATWERRFSAREECNINERVARWVKLASTQTSSQEWIWCVSNCANASGDEAIIAEHHEAGRRALLKLGS